MANQQSTLKFDHREIAVIFSLFIFVSLLMFTVGILVGKGLTQARFEGHGGARTLSESHVKGHGETSSHEAGVSNVHEGTSITTGDASDHSAGHAEDHAESGLDADPHHSSDVAATTDHDSHDAGSGLELVPAHPKEKRGGLDDFAKNKETNAILRNPKIAGIFDGSDEPSGGSTSVERTFGGAQRNTASVGGKIPKSLAQGKYTVQVGSYPNQREALERVDALKKLGFPYAFFSAKNFGEKQQTWFRVSLGFFPDKSTAEASGELLQARGEVNSYLVRRSEAGD